MGEIIQMIAQNINLDELWLNDNVIWGVKGLRGVKGQFSNLVLTDSIIIW